MFGGQNKRTMAIYGTFMLVGYASLFAVVGGLGMIAFDFMTFKQWQLSVPVVGLVFIYLGRKGISDGANKNIEQQRRL